MSKHAMGFQSNMENERKIFSPNNFSKGPSHTVTTHPVVFVFISKEGESQGEGGG